MRPTTWLRRRKRDPKDARILLASADVAQRRGDAPEARKWWAKGVADHDDDPALSAGLVALDLQQGRPEAALAVVEKVRERHPLDSEAQLPLHRGAPPAESVRQGSGRDRRSA